MLIASWTFLPSLSSLLPSLSHFLLLAIHYDCPFYAFFSKISLDSFVIYKVTKQVFRLPTFSSFVPSRFILSLRDFPVTLYKIYRAVIIGRHINKNTSRYRRLFHRVKAEYIVFLGAITSRSVNYPRNYPTGSLMTFALEKVSHNYFLS